MLSVAKFLLNIFPQLWHTFASCYDFSCVFVNGRIFFLSKLIILVAWSLKKAQKFFIKSSPRYKQFLFSIWSNYQIFDTGYLQGMCFLIVVVEDFSELFLKLSISLIKDSMSA